MWSDEFNGPAAAPPDPSNWNYDIGGGGWGNSESEVYTNYPQNVQQDGKGNLVIRAIRDAAGNYTSARLQTGSPGASTHTADRSWQYGRIVGRIKLPYGQGIWPAFWMLGESIGSVGWPDCGEIDIMENFGALASSSATNTGTAHGPGYAGGISLGKSYLLPLGQTVADDYHVYAVEWSPNSIEWFVDGIPYYKITPASLPAGSPWVFNAPFFVVLNLAIGGSTAGSPDPGAPFPPQEMLVDYVRVYQSFPAGPLTPVITPGGVVNAASYLGGLAPGSLATIYGKNLALSEYTTTGLSRFPTSLGGTAVLVDGTPAALVYASPTQINFQVPWTSSPGLAVPIVVNLLGYSSRPEVVTLLPAAPASFLSELSNGVAWVTGPDCPATQCAVQPGGVYQLWGNGFGPKNGPSQDGVPAQYTGTFNPLEVPGTSNNCRLAIDGKPATVQYCGAAPGEIIDQLNFTYPSGVTPAPFVDAALTISGVTGHFRIPGPPL